MTVAPDASCVALGLCDGTVWIFDLDPRAVEAHGWELKGWR